MRMKYMWEISPVVTSLIFLLFGAIVIFGIKKEIDISPNSNISEIITYTSIEDLSNAVGYLVKQVHDLPFDVISISYTSFGDAYAEVKYNGDCMKAIFSMNPFVDFSCTDSSNYSLVEMITINGNEVTIKGNNQKFNIAVWESDGFCFAMYFSESISKSVIFKMIEGTS